MDTPKRTRNKIQNLYLNEETHATLKALAAHQEMTIQGLAASWLEETQPILQNMVNALDDIKNGKDTLATYNNFIAKGLQSAGDAMAKEENDDATDNRKDN